MMAYAVLEMSDQAFVSVNLPLLLFDFLASIFYMWCLIFRPCNGQRLKPPLKVLLGLLVLCTMVYCACLTAPYFFLSDTKGALSFSLFRILFYNVHITMTVYVWLNFYSYTQIVPGQRALFMWVKRNIKMVIYVILFFNWIIILVSNVGEIITVINASEPLDTNTTLQGHFFNDLVGKIPTIMFNLYLLVCMCVTAVSSFSTVRYLHKHIGRMSQSGVSSESLRRQMRVTITGIFQGVISVLFYTYYLYMSFNYIRSENILLDFKGHNTAATVYISCTVLSLGIGQSIFRENVCDIWKAVKVVCGDGTFRDR